MSVLHLNSNTFKETIESEKLPVLIDFFADWCMPCKMFAPILEKAASLCDGKAVIAKLNIDEAEPIALEHKVMSIPTVILFKDGKEVRRSVGAMSQKELLDFIEI